jgi:hypothetical protein
MKVFLQLALLVTTALALGAFGEKVAYHFGAADCFAQGAKLGECLGKKEEDDLFFNVVQELKENCSHKSGYVTNAAGTKTVSFNINCEAKFWP